MSEENIETIDERVHRILDDNQKALKKALLHYIAVEYSSEINDMRKRGLIDSADSAKLFNSAFEDVPDISYLFEDSIFRIAKIISELKCWDSEYREKIKENLNNIHTVAEFYDDIWKDIIDSVKKEVEALIENCLNNQAVCLVDEETAKIVEKLFDKADIIKKADYMAHNRWYDEDWYDATALEYERVTKFLLDESIPFEALEKDSTLKVSKCYYYASKEIYQMMFGRHKLNAVCDETLKEYIELLNPTESLYALMLSYGIPALMDYKKKFESSNDRISFSKMSVVQRKDVDQKKINKCFFKAMTYNVNDVGFVPGKTSSNVLKNWLRALGYKSTEDFLDLIYSKADGEETSDNELEGLVLAIKNDGLLLIPKILTLKLEKELQKLDLSVESVKESLKYGHGKTEKSEHENERIQRIRNDYLFDSIVYDEQFISGLSGNRWFSNTCSEKRRSKVEDAINYYFKVLDETARDKIAFYEEQISPKKSEEQISGRKSTDKYLVDTVSKKKTFKNKWEFHNEFIRPELEERWNKLSGLHSTDADNEKSIERIEACLKLIAYYLSPDITRLQKVIDDINGKSFTTRKKIKK